MKNINSKSDLDRSIYALTQLKSAQEILLKAQFERILESLKPANIIITTFSDIANSPDLLKSILSTSLGLISGFVSKKIFVGYSNNPFRKFLGNIIQIGVTTVISTNPDAVKTLGNKFIGTIFQRKSKS